MANQPSLVTTQIKPNSTAKEPQPSLFIQMMLKPMALLKHGSLTLNDHQGWQRQFGDADALLRAEIHVSDHRFYRAVANGGSIGAAEAYMAGWWHSPDLTMVVRLLAANINILDKFEAQSSWLTRIWRKLNHSRNRNSVSGSKRNIAQHYDLSNAFYQLFLDDSMMYSSAVYPESDTELKQAAEYKMKLLCDDLALTPNDHLLEIGTGWGGLACYAAENYGCKVTTTTISQAQFEFASARVEERGLRDQITVLQQDYRHLEGRYSKIISIEMIEAVGHANLKTFFKTCAGLLKPNGKMVLQAITIADQRESHYRRSVDFIQRYIFPGGYLPSVAVLSQQVAQFSDLSIRHLRDIGMDYARTLADWRANFEAQLDKVYALGFDEEFVRMWRFYLCYCEGGFRERTTSTVQMVLEKPPR